MNSKFGTQFALKLLKSPGKLGFLGLIGSQSARRRDPVECYCVKVYCNGKAR
jgi:hypothetical protein